MIKAYVIDGRTIQCDKDENPILNQQRAVARKFEHNETIEEKKLLDRVRLEKFDPIANDAYKWIMRMLSRYDLKYSKILSITRILSNQLGFVLTREIYRRKMCCLYWLCQHLAMISDYLMNHDVQIVIVKQDKKEDVITLSPPQKRPAVNFDVFVDGYMDIELESYQNSYADDISLAFNEELF